MATRKGTSAGARKSSAKKGGSKKAAGGGISEVLKSVNIDESVVQDWRERIRDLGGKVDVKKSLDAAKKLASQSGDAIKKAGGKNPSLFYSGLAAIVVGAGMMTAAHKIKTARGGSKKKSSGSKKSR